MASLSSPSYASVPVAERDAASRIPLTLVFAALGIVGLLLILVITPYGTALAHGDAVTYYSAAWSFARGDGFRLPDSALYVRWPPLYPSLIAGWMQLGVTGTHSIRIVNAVAFGLTVVCSGLLLSMVVRSILLVVLGTVAVLVSWPLVLVAYFGLSESVFSLLVVLFLFGLLRYLRQPSLTSLLLMAVAAGLACIQRYLGAGLLLGGGACILFLNHRRAKTIAVRDAAVFGIVAGIPLGVWFLRNLGIVGNVVGSDWDQRVNNTQLAPQLIINWFWPEANVVVTDDPVVGIVVMFGILVALVGGAAALRRWAVPPANFPPGQAIIPLLAVGVVLLAYLGVFVVLASRVWVDVTERMFAPLFIPFGLLALAVVDDLATWLDRRLPRRAGTALMAAMLVLWLIRPSAKIVREVGILSISDGAMGYNNLAWRQSDLIAWLKANLRDQPVYSNADYPVFILTDRYVQRAGRSMDEWDDFDLPPGEAFYYAWFSDVEQNGCNRRSAPCFEPSYTLDELETLFEIQPVLSMDAGTVYHLVKR